MLSRKRQRGDAADESTVVVQFAAGGDTHQLTIVTSDCASRVKAELATLTGKQFVLFDGDGEEEIGDDDVLADCAGFSADQSPALVIVAAESELFNPKSVNLEETYGKNKCTSTQLTELCESRAGSCINCIDISDCLRCLEEDSAIDALAALPHLSEIVARSCNILNSDMTSSRRVKKNDREWQTWIQKLALVVQRSKSLTRVTFHGSGLEHERAQWNSLLGRTETLTRSGIRTFPDPQVPPCMDIELDACAGSADFSRKQMQPGGALVLAALLPRFQSIHTLNVSNTCLVYYTRSSHADSVWDFSGCIALAEAVAAHPTLTALDVSRNAVGAAARDLTVPWMPDGEAVHRNAPPRTNERAFTLDGAVAMGRAVAANHGLRSLCFTGGRHGRFGFDDGAVVRLEDSLQAIDLSCVDLGGGGALQLAGFLPRCAAVTSVDLRGTNLNGHYHRDHALPRGEDPVTPGHRLGLRQSPRSAIRELLLALAQLRKMTYLNLSCNHLGFPGAKLLRTSLEGHVPAEPGAELGCGGPQFSSFEALATLEFWNNETSFEDDGDDDEHVELRLLRQVLEPRGVQLVCPNWQRGLPREGGEDAFYRSGYCI
jgi:hypothetical protein